LSAEAKKILALNSTVYCFIEYINKQIAAVVPPLQ